MKVLWFTVAYDQNYQALTQQMVNSFKKFHPKEELKVFGMNEIQALLPHPAYQWQMSLTPLFLQKLMPEYDCIVRLDGDMIILGDLSHVTEGDFDVAVAQNSSPYDWKNHMRMTGQRLSVHDVDPLDYVNCGFVVVKSNRFAQHWWRLVNAPFFTNYPFREQDMLNILTRYFPYNVKYLDKSNKWHGMIAKGYTAKTTMKDGRVILPKSDWPTDEDKELVCYHYGGGAGVKGKYRLLFPEDVADHISKLIK